jgi:hypothetical protein
MFLCAALAGASMFASSPAMAMEDLIIVGDTEEHAADEPRWVVCFRWDQSNDYKYVSNIRRSTYGETRGQLSWGDFILKNYKVSDKLYGGCNVEESEKDANWRYNLFREHDPNFPKTLVEVEWTGPIGKAGSEVKGGKTTQAKKDDKAQGAARDSGPTPSEIAAEKHRAVEERNRAAQEKYEAELAEQKRKVEEFEQAQAEVARKKAEQTAAAQAALAAHDAQLAVAAEAQRKHEADLAKYEQEVATQKLRKDFDERHKLGQASTDFDANQCVTAPETQLNASFQGNTAASVINGCGKPVDVRICLMTDKGWNCGVTYGLGSQQRWSHSSFNATGQVFSDAKTSGSSRTLSSPN